MKVSELIAALNLRNPDEEVLLEDLVDFRAVTIGDTISEEIEVRLAFGLIHIATINSRDNKTVISGYRTAGLLETD